MRLWSILGCATALAVVISLTEAPAWAQGGYQGGEVLPCNLSGINPADHPGIFNNPEVAKKFGFVKGKDGNWHVKKGCRSPG